MTAIAASAIDTATAIRRVKATLRGPVLDIMTDFQPELRALSRYQAYERALDDLGLLERCFQTFHQERTRFRFLLVNDQRQPVDDDAQPLACGRSLNEVVSMVVRSAARRYFRRHLRPRRPAVARVQERGLMQRLWMAFSGTDAKKATRSPARLHRSPADELYNAIKDYLLHDWQVPLVPTYADMKPSQVRDFGPRLLDYRDEESLRAALRGAPPPVAPQHADPSPATVAPTASPAAPAPIPAAPSALGGYPSCLPPDWVSADGDRLRAEALAPTLLRPDVRAALRNPDNALFVTRVLSCVGTHAAEAMVERLGFDNTRVAVFLVSAHDALGDDVFRRIFGAGSDPALVDRLIHQAQLAGIGPRTSLPDCAGFVSRLFGRFSGTR